MKLKKWLWFSTSCILFFVHLSVQTAHGERGEVPSPWAESDVRHMEQAGLIPEALKGSYTSPITREEYAMLIEAVLHHVTDAQEALHRVLVEHRFEDTWEEAVYEAFAFGIVNGLDEQRFLPSRNIRRKEAAVMLSNLLYALDQHHSATIRAPYVDYEAIPQWARDAANATYQAGIFRGSEAGLEPDKPYTREQAIVTMRRLTDVIGEVDKIAYRGKIFVALDEIDDVRVDVNEVLIGSPKSKGDFERLWKSIADNFPAIQPDSMTAETFVSNGFVIDTHGSDYLIRITWE